MQIQCGIFLTRARVAKLQPSQTFEASCPLWSAPKDTIGHHLGTRFDRSIKNQLCVCHGAVHEIATEIRSGILGECALYCMRVQ